MTIPEALKQLYTAIGGTASDVADCTLTVDVLNKLAAFLEGDSNATQNVEAIMNIVAVAGNLIPDPTLIDKNITANGTYNAADDEADGYKKVVVDVQSDNNAKFVAVAGHRFNKLNDYIESIEIPYGMKNIGTAAVSMTPFDNCPILKEVTVPSTVTEIYGYAFQTCAALEKITINKPEGSITGAPWGAPASCQIVWLG